MASPTLQRQTFPWGDMSWRENGEGDVVLLLHGISSGSAAWVKQFTDPALQQQCHLLAWDAPGYGASSVLPARALAVEYALRLTQWLEERVIAPTLVLGHSLGALIAAAYAASQPAGLQGVILADPAAGYGAESPERRQQIYQQRQQQFATLGAKGYAQERAPWLLRPGALEADLYQVRYSMSRLQPEGFAHAGWMLAHDDIHRYLPQITVAAEVWCGDQDGITPPSGAQALAEGYGWPFHLLSQAGHASYLEAAPQFNQRLQTFIHSLAHSRVKEKENIS